MTSANITTRRPAVEVASYWLLAHCMHYGVLACRALRTLRVVSCLSCWLACSDTYLDLAAGLCDKLMIYRNHDESLLGWPLWAEIHGAHSAASFGGRPFSKANWSPAGTPPEEICLQPGGPYPLASDAAIPQQKHDTSD
jgi:hypothetical protein